MASVVAAGILSMQLIMPVSVSAAPASAPVNPATVVYSLNDPHNPLHLTTPQQMKMHTVINGIVAEQKKLTANKSESTTQKNQEYSAYLKTAQVQINAILTPAQLSKKEQRDGEIKSEMAKYQQGVADLGKKAGAIQSQLKASITPAQNAKINKIKADAQQQWTAIQTNKALSPDQMMAKRDIIAQSVNAQMEKVLTPQQQSLIKQYQTLRQEAVELARLAMTVPQNVK